MVVIIVGAGKGLTASGADVRLVTCMLAVVAIVVHQGGEHLVARPAHNLVLGQDDGFRSHNEAGGGIFFTYIQGDSST